MDKEQVERMDIDYGVIPNVLKGKCMDVFKDFFCRSSYN